MQKIWLLTMIVCNTAFAELTFFYKESIPKHLYQSQQNVIIKVNFPFTKEMKESNLNLSAVLVDLCTPYTLQSATYKTRNNSIYLQIDDYDFWLTKFHQVYDQYTKLITNYKVITPNVFDSELNLGVDSDYAQQKFKNIKMFQDIVHDTMEKYNNVTMLETDKNDMLLVVTTLELMNNDMKHFFGTFSDLYQTLNLAKKGQISDLLSERISKNNEQVDWSKTEILKGGSNTDIVIFIIKLAIKSTPIEYYSLKPISYYGYSLENNYYMLKENQKIKKFYQSDILTPQDAYHLNKCLHGLNNKIHIDVYEHCIFTKSDKTYEIINRGIIFNNATDNIISQLKTIFSNQITKDDFPIVVHFNGSINVTDKSFKTVPITKRYTNFFEKSSLSKKSLEMLKNTLFTQPENYMLELLQEEIIGVGISFALIIILLITIALSKMVYRKLKYKSVSQKPQEKLLIKKLRANRRN
jgi:hypothetical protein